MPRDFVCGRQRRECGRAWRVLRGLGRSRAEPLASAKRIDTIGAMDPSALITIDPAKCDGKPCVRGLRITVDSVLDYLASGMSEAEILADFPDLTAEDIRACVEHGRR